MTFVSYAQNFEDVLLWRALRHVEHGRYLDIGAQDPVNDSVSRAFYEAGWRGVHVEPTACCAELLREARPDETVIEAAVTDAPGPIPFYELGGLSSGRADVAEHHKKSGHQPQTILVPTVRLENLFGLLDGEVHWLKIDVEGMEADVLRSWGNSSIRPWILVIESTFPNSEKPTHNLWVEDVLRRGYAEVFFDGLSRYFVHDQHAKLADLLNRPANVFDSYQITQQHFSAQSLREEVSLMQQASEAREAQHAALLLEHDERTRLLTVDLDRQRAEYSSLRDRSAAELDEARARVESAEGSLAVSLAQLDQLSKLHRETSVKVEKLNDDLTTERETREALASELLEVAKLADSQFLHFPDFGSKLRSVPSGLAFAAVKSRLRLASQEVELLRDHAERQYDVGRSARDSEVTFFTERIAALQADIADARGRADQFEAACAAARDRTMSAEIERAALQSLLNDHARVRPLIGAVVAERPGRWQRIGLALGLTRPSSARMALESWIETSPAGATASLSGHTTPQPTETHMLPPSTGQERNPYLRANSLAELLAWDDVDFVRCSYVTVLGRQPDADGEANYAYQIRTGRSKLDVLWQLRRSGEGALHDPGIAGLDRRLRRASRARMRVIGAVFRSIYRLEGDSAADRRQRSMMNDLRVLIATDELRECKLQMSNEILVERLQGLERQLDSLHQSAQQKLDDQPIATPVQRRLVDPVDLTSAAIPEEVIRLFKAAINSSCEMSVFHARAQ